MRWMDLRGVSVASMLVLACGGSVIPEDDDTGAQDGSSGESSGADESTGAIDLGPDCAPPEESLALEDDLILPGSTCVVVDELDAETATFECQAIGGTGPGMIRLGATPPIALDLLVGTEVTIDATHMMSEWEQNEHASFFVRDAATGELLVAKIDALDESWTTELAPLTLQPIADACTSEPDESDCLSNTRRMWTARHGDATALVGDRTQTQVGAYVVHIQRATQGQLLECIDVETDFYEALIVRTQ